MTDSPTVARTPTLQGGAGSKSGYMVLLATEDGWTVVGKNLTARGPEHAIRIWGEKAEELNGATVVAIPARSWKPVKVTAKVETTLVVEEAS